MDLKKEFSYDADKAVNGVWSDIGDGCRLLVARMNNANYNKALRKAVLPFSRRGGSPSVDQNRQILVRCTSRHVLLGWEGLTEDGTEVEYSEEEAYRLMTTYEEFFQLVVGIAADSDNYRT